MEKNLYISFSFTDETCYAIFSISKYLAIFQNRNIYFFSKKQLLLKVVEK